MPATRVQKRSAARRFNQVYATHSTNPARSAFVYRHGDVTCASADSRSAVFPISTATSLRPTASLNWIRTIGARVSSFVVFIGKEVKNKVKKTMEMEKYGCVFEKGYDI